MHFGDRPAACGLSVGIEMVADAGVHIDSEAAAMIKLGYVDDGVGGDFLLLLGCTSTVKTEAEDPELGDFRACSALTWIKWRPRGPL